MGQRWGLPKLAVCGYAARKMQARPAPARSEEDAMKIVQTDDIPLKRGLEHRGGVFHSRIMAEGAPGALDNFQLSFGQMGGDFNSPRHRHNFEQIRYQLEGLLDYGRDGKLAAGMVGYFPEAVYYGPQSQDPAISCKTIVLQFGGASGSGYLSQAEVRAGMDALRSEGEFKDGVFRRRADVEGKRNMDGYQAIWEHVNGRSMVYPKPRYPQPIFMDPANYEWVPVAGAPGVAEKLLGVFTERRSEAGFYRLDAGARFTAHGKGVYVATVGAGTVGGAPLRTLTTIYLDAGETVEITAAEPTELLHFGLPNLAGLEVPLPDLVPAQAAE
jgi:hypothetical protein